MSTHQVSKPRSANQSMTEEYGRPGTCRSNVGCPAMEEPCTNRIVPRGFAPAVAFCHRKRRTAPSLVFLVVQCYCPFMPYVSPWIVCKNPRADDMLPEEDAMTAEQRSRDTLPKRLIHHAAGRADRPAIREKDLGIWQT